MILIGFIDHTQCYDGLKTFPADGHGHVHASILSEEHTLMISVIKQLVDAPPLCDAQIDIICRSIFNWVIFQLCEVILWPNTVWWWWWWCHYYCVDTSNHNLMIKNEEPCDLWSILCVSMNHPPPYYCIVFTHNWWLQPTEFRFRQLYPEHYSSD